MASHAEPRRLVTALALALAAFVATRAADACAACGSGDPTLSVMGADRAFAGRVRVAAQFRQSTVRVGDPGPDEILLGEEQLELLAAYAPLKELFVSASMPLLWRQVAIAGHPAQASFVPGDLELRARTPITGTERRRAELALHAGVKLPTAPLQEDERGQPLPAAAQPGTGAISPLAGASVIATRGMWSLAASGTLYLPFAVRAGAHASASFRTGTSVQAQPIRVFACRLGFNTRLDATAEKEGGETDPNSGGFVGYVATEMIWSPATDLLLTIGAHFPVVQALKGEHRQTPIVAAGVTYDL